MRFDTPNWQMTVLFLLALALLGFLMKWVAMLRPAKVQTDRPLISRILPLPTQFTPWQGTTHMRRIFPRAFILLAIVSLAYWIYWELVRSFGIHGILLSYLAAPFVLLLGELYNVLADVVLLPTRRPLPRLHNRPWLARSVADFWGNRWNLWFRDWFRCAIFAPLRRHPAFAFFLVFAVSGLMHEWVINVPLYYLTGRMLFGSMMIYFLLQAVGIEFERHFLPNHPRLNIAFAWFVVFVPLPLLINEGLLRTFLLWPRQV